MKSLTPKERNGSNPQIGKQLCDKLFELEKAYAGLVSEVRYKNRLKFSKPVVDELYAWASSLNAIPKSGLGKAVYYLLSQNHHLYFVAIDAYLAALLTRKTKQTSRHRFAQWPVAIACKFTNLQLKIVAPPV